MGPIWLVMKIIYKRSQVKMQMGSPSPMQLRSPAKVGRFPYRHVCKLILSVDCAAQRVAGRMA